MKTAE